MATYVYECQCCNKLRVVTRISNDETCCGTLMSRTKTYKRSIYEQGREKSR